MGEIRLLFLSKIERENGMRQDFNECNNILDVEYQYYGDTGLAQKHKTVVVTHYLMGDQPEFVKSICEKGHNRLLTTICFENKSKTSLEVMIRDQLPEACKGEVSNIRLDEISFSKEELRKGIYCGTFAPKSHFELLYEVDFLKESDVCVPDSRAAGFVRVCEEGAGRQEWIEIGMKLI